MGIPEAREELMQIAKKLDRLAHGNISAEIRAVIETHMHRQMVKPRRAPMEASPVTPHARDAIKRLVARQPDLSNVEIGKQFNLNPGRVSDILAGRYD